MTRIQDLLEKVKLFYTPILLLVIGSIFFALGRLSVLERAHTPIKIENISSSQPALALEASQSLEAPQVGESGGVIGSKTGKKYYFPWCGTVKRIKPENQVHFASIDEAKKAGFTPGGNCKGLN
jgi:hypothetical protein